MSSRSVLAGVPGGIAGSLRKRRGEAVRFKWVGGDDVEIVAWRLGDNQTAQRVLRQWRSALRRRHPATVAVGDNALRLSARGAKAAGLVVVRVGSVLATVRFHTAQVGAPIDEFVLGVAGTEAAQLRRALSLTAFDALRYRVARAHGPTKTLALAAFALIGGHGPGIRPPPRNAGFVDGTEALSWVLEALPRLSAPQQKAVRAYVARTFPNHPTTVPRARAAGVMTSGDYQAIANQMLALIEAHTGPLDITPKVVKAKTTQPGLYAETNITIGCAITVFSNNDSKPLNHQQHTLAHELGHCMQRKYRGLLGSNALNLPVDWLYEGLPEWIADSVVPVAAGSVSAGFLNSYDSLPGYTLDQWSYEAAGFFGHVADVAGDATLWKRIPQIMAASNTSDGLTATVQSNAQEVYDTWGGSYAQRTDLGKNWLRINPLPGEPAHLGETTVTRGTTKVLVPDGSVSVPAPAASGRLYQVTTAQPFLRIAPRPGVFGRMADVSGLDLQINQTAGRVFCTEGKCDQCPEGTEGTLPVSEPIGLPLLVGLSAGTPPAAGTVVFTGEPLSKYCTPKPLQVPNTGDSQGDPHMATGDGDFYNFQSLGEFTLVKSTRDSLEIQQRQQRWTDSPNDVALNTAVAMRVGKARVEIDGTVTGTLVRVNGKKATPTADHPLRLAGGGRVSIDAEGQVDVRWADRSLAAVQTVSDGRFVQADVQFTPARARAGKLVGLLGNFNGDPSDDFTTRSGEHLDASLMTDEIKGFSLRYGRFADSWRIKPSQSLFTYPHGKSTRSYTVRPFPRRPFGLDTADHDEAVRICTEAGITDPDLLANCAADRGATHQDLFVAGAAAQQQARKPTPAATALASQPVAVGTHGYRLRIGAFDDGAGGKPEVTVELSRTEGQSLQSHIYSPANVAFHASGATARLSAPAQGLGEIDMRFVATGGTTFSKPPAGCTGPFTIEQHGMLTGRLLLHADASYFGTLSIRSVPATLSREHPGDVRCATPPADPGDVTLSSAAGTNPLELLTATRHAGLTDVTALAIDTRSDGTTVVHSISSSASALTATADLTSAHLAGSGPFLAGGLDFTATDELGPLSFGTAQGDLTLEFDSIGTLQPWAAAATDAQLRTPG